jgi:hypothetical protein
MPRNDVKKIMKKITRFNLSEESESLINIFRLLQGQNDFYLFKAWKDFSDYTVLTNNYKEK